MTTAARELDRRCIDTIRFLAVDAVEKARSGHPGMPMGVAPTGYVLWTRFLQHSPANPHWFDRDRFVLSAGHGSMLQYALLHLTGYDLGIIDLKQFRQFGSRTPGHPERTFTPGVETTTGPLGQGLGNAVGMAIAEAHLAARFNRPGHDIVDHRTYVIASDGDLMEGVGAEAASLAGHLRLHKLVCLYDDNRITLSASTAMNFSEDRGKRFEAYGWFVQDVADGEDIDAIERALRAARDERERPSIIIVRTHIGFGAPHKQDTFEAHGSPLGADEVQAAKLALGWPLEPTFLVPDDVREHMGQARERGHQAEAEWSARLDAYHQAFPTEAQELEHMMSGEPGKGWDADLPRFAAGGKPEATRTALGKAMNAAAARLPELVGGSGDLNPSTFTALDGLGDFQAPGYEPADRQGAVGGVWGYAGRNLHFGVREHAMAAACNGIAAHGGLHPYAATFLVFSDYLRPSLRLSALMKLRVLFVLSHDSVGLGEDGPSHQPIEHLLALRAIPGLTVIRPADANEAVGALRVAVEHRTGPVALILTRQKLPVLDPDQHPGISTGVGLGAYVLADPHNGGPIQFVLVASGSEVHLALEARELLEQDGCKARVVSMPSWDLFAAQRPEYHERVLPPGVPALAVEAGVTLGWRPYIGAGLPAIGIDKFGSSAPGEVVMREYGLTVERIRQRALEILKKGPRA
jgi:transketolase